MNMSEGHTAHSCQARMLGCTTQRGGHGESLGEKLYCVTPKRVRGHVAVWGVGGGHARVCGGWGEGTPGCVWGGGRARQGVWGLGPWPRPIAKVVQSEVVGSDQRIVAGGIPCTPHARHSCCAVVLRDEAMVSGPVGNGPCTNSF